jgi:hypothetical protein
MRTFITFVGLLGLVAGLAVSGAQASGVSPAGLQRAGWSCVNPAVAFPDNPNVHCFPPGQLEGVITGAARTALLLAFATSDVNAEEAPLLGTERMIRADLFHNQPARPTRRAAPPVRPAAHRSTSGAISARGSGGTTTSVTPSTAPGDCGPRMRQRGRAPSPGHVAHRRHVVWRPSSIRPASVIEVSASGARMWHSCRRSPRRLRSWWSWGPALGAIAPSRVDTARITDLTSRRSPLVRP